MSISILLLLLDCMCRFDCVYPTRTARFGVALVRHGSLRIRAKEHATEAVSLDGPDTTTTTISDTEGITNVAQDPCACPTCQRYTRAYLHALLRDHSTEALAAQLITCHNIAYMMGLMRSMRAAVMQGQTVFEQYVNCFLKLQFPDPKDVPVWAVDALTQGAGIKLTHILPTTAAI